MTNADAPLMMKPQRASTSWTVLPSFLTVPGLGTLAVNAFLLKDAAPLLVDTGLSALCEDFLETLEQEIDLEDLRWIWVSHMDADHIGNLRHLLEKAPRAKVVTTSLGVGKMNLAGLDVSRVALLRPGECFDTGSRSLVPLRPPYFDAPETVGFVDACDGILFVADSFGALLAQPEEVLEDINDEVLRDGLVAWSTVDAPWLEIVDPDAFASRLRTLQQLSPDVVLSSHLPWSSSGIGRLTTMLSETWCTGAVANSDPLSIDAVAAALGCEKVEAKAVKVS
jgi:glyoxylase-like metal-dependent hydrolase (beta-lactamase superfamily II)